jgi:hypothetical protein
MVRSIDGVSRKSVASNDSGLTFRERMKKSAHHRRAMTQPAPIIEGKSGSSRHRKSMTSFLPTMADKKVSNSSQGRMELVHSQGKSHRRSRSLPQSGLARKSHTCSMSSLGAFEIPGNSLEQGTTFYVRVSLGSLTGMKVSRNSKKKNKTTDNFLITGYASLASTGNQIAVSQPFAPDLEELYSKSSKLTWATSGDEKTRGRRQLYFSLKLHEESLKEENTRDDTSVKSQCSYLPKVVKIVIGLMSGEEKMPLGIANLVVNGKAGKSNKLDLAMRPMDDSSDKKRLGIFGSSKKQGISFSDDCWYSLSSNATLGVTVDTTTGKVGETKREIWGEDGDSMTGSRSTRESRTGQESSEIASLDVNTKREPRTGPESSGIPAPDINTNRPESSETPSPDVNTSPESSDTPSPDVNTNREPDHTPEEFMYPTIPSPRKTQSRNMSMTSIPLASFPLEYVTVTSTGSKSSTSDLSSRRSVLYGMPCEMTSTMVTSCFGGLCGNRDTLVEEPEEVEFNKLGHEINGGFHIMEDTRKHKLAGKQAVTDIPDATSLDIAGDSYEDLKDAQETLRRYAKKAGIDIEDILDKVEASAQKSLSE